jgi:hypothetical protein
MWQPSPLPPSLTVDPSSAQYIEVYNEEINDLLNESPDPEEGMLGTAVNLRLLMFIVL